MLADLAGAHREAKEKQDNVDTLLQATVKVFETMRGDLASHGQSIRTQCDTLANYDLERTAGRTCSNVGTEDWQKDAQLKLGLKGAVVSMRKLLKKENRLRLALRPHRAQRMWKSRC